MSRVTAMARRTAWAVGLMLSITACGPPSTGSEQTARPPVSSPRAGLCDLLDVPLQYMAPSHLTFAEMAKNDPSQDRGAGDMIGVLYSARSQDAGRFRPVLRFLAHRSTVATTPGHGQLPTASDAVVRNARALDAWLEDGGCD